PTPSAQPSHQESPPPRSVTLQDAGTGWEALGPVFPVGDGPRLIRTASSVGFVAAPTAGGNSLPDGVDHLTPGRTAGPTEAAPVAAGASFGSSTATPSQRLGDGNAPASEPVAAPATRAAVGHAEHLSCDAEAAVHAGFDLASLRGGPSPSN